MASSSAEAGATSSSTAVAPTTQADEARIAPAESKPSRGVELVATADGEVAGIAIGPVPQCYAMIEQFLHCPRILAFPTAERYSIAGKVAAVPDEHARIRERLLAGVSSSATEAGSLNALYLLLLCKELVPGFAQGFDQDRLTKSAELSAHSRVQAVVLLDEKPAEWTKAESSAAAVQVIMMPEQQPSLLDEAGDVIYDAGQAVGDGAKFVGGAAFGGVGAISDGLGFTTNAEREMTNTAESAVDLVGNAFGGVVDTIDHGIDGTMDEFHRKGVTGAVGDAATDTVNMVTDFVQDAVFGIADGVSGLLDWAANTEAPPTTHPGCDTHKVLIEVKELFGEERSLGLRLENRVLTKFTKPEAEKLGWKICDCIIGMTKGPVATQEELLAAIAEEKEALKASGTPMKFLVERLGPKPAPKVSKIGDLVFVQGQTARVKQVNPKTGEMICKVQEDGRLVKIVAPPQ